MKKFTFAYGSGTVDAELDENNILAVLHGSSVPPAEDIPSLVLQALESPIGCAPLSSSLTGKEKIALIVSDMSRFWMRQDLVVPHVAAYLTERCGIPCENITIVIANGTHTGGDEAEHRTLVTDGVYDRFRVVNHDCLAPDLVYIGTTPHGTEVRINPFVAEADCVVALGACVHHVMAGFGGGRKSIVPGVSSMATICHNHAFSLDPVEFCSNPRIGNGVLEGNPLHEDMCEAAALIPNLFMINLVMNADMKLTQIFAGHYLESWLEACKAADAIYRVPVPCQADAVIVSCGGYPKDMSLYQGTKTIDNIEPGLKNGGTLILLIEARDGGGPEEYFGWCDDLLNGTQEKRLREHFTVPGYIFLLNCEQAKRYRIMMLTSIPQEKVAPMGIEAYSDMKELLANAHLEGKSLYVIPNGSTVLPHVE